MKGVLETTGLRASPSGDDWPPAFMRHKRDALLPHSVAPQDAVLVTFWRRLPLDHDGLVGPAAGDDVLRRSAGRLLWQRDTTGQVRWQS